MTNKDIQELRNCVEYCRQQNGRSSCKNCGLTDEMIDNALHQVEQRGVEKAIEKMKIEGEMGKLTPFQETANTYIKNRGEEILQALNPPSPPIKV